MKSILESERLILREFNLGDARFIIDLLNSPGWLEFIGDRKIKTIKDAENYLLQGPLKSYAQHGYGLYLVELKAGKVALGICGLLKRDFLTDPDIGFAFLPEHSGQSYAFEAAKAMMDHGYAVLKLNKIVAITEPHNVRSIRLLNKLGLHFEKPVRISNENNELLLFTEG